MKLRSVTYVAIITHIYKKTVEVHGLKCFECLAPDKICNSNSCDYILRIAKLLPLKDIDFDNLKIEWQLLQLDSDVSFVQKQDQRIDEYWALIFSLQNGAGKRYPLITQVVKAALSLPHGSASVERGFSESGKILTDDQTNMQEKTLDARLIVRDGLKRYNSKPHLVPITNDLLKLAKTARSEYSNYLEDQRRLEAERKRKIELDEKEKTKK